MLQSPLTANVRITCQAALNATACMCQTICDDTSSNVLERLVQCEQIGEVGWYVHPKGENSMAASGFGCNNRSAGSFSY